MAAAEHLGNQFHEMTRSEFEATPGTRFHGHPTGNFNADPGGPQGFHVGTHLAATQAVTARAGYGAYSDNSRIPAPYKPTSSDEAHPEQIRGGRVVSPMVNHTQFLGSYGKGSLGDMNDSGDAMANGRVSAINTRGQTMRQGIYYKNASEDAGSISAVLPNRQSFKTHEDYIVEARAKGLPIPQQALESYQQIPGQQKLF